VCVVCVCVSQFHRKTRGDDEDDEVSSDDREESNVLVLRLRGGMDCKLNEGSVCGAYAGLFGPLSKRTPVCIRMCISSLSPFHASLLCPLFSLAFAFPPPSHLSSLFVTWCI